MVGFRGLGTTDAADALKKLKSGASNLNSQDTNSGGMFSGFSEGMGDIFGKDGWGIGAFGALSGLAQAFLGSQQLGVAKDTLNFQKSAFDTQLANTAKTNNTYKNDLYLAKLQAAQGNPTAQLSSLADYKTATDVSGVRT